MINKLINLKSITIYFKVLFSKNSLSFAITYWLSADTRENANDWINHIDWTLTSIRLWNPNAVKPICKKTA